MPMGAMLPRVARRPVRGAALVWDGNKPVYTGEGIGLSLSAFSVTPARLLYGAADGSITQTSSLTFDATTGLAVTPPITTLAALNGKNTVLTFNDSGTANTPVIESINHTSSGTAGTGFGCEYDFNAQSSNGTLRAQASIISQWNSAIDATRKGELYLYAYDTAAREGVRVRANGTVPITMLSAVGGRTLIGTTTDDGSNLLQVAGAIKAAGTVFGNVLQSTGGIAATSTTTGDLILAGGAGILGALWIGSTANFAGTITATNSSWTTAGKLTLANGTSGAGSLVLDDTSVAGGNSREIAFLNSTSAAKYNFKIGAQLLLDNVLSIARSTVAGGSSYSQIIGFDGATGVVTTGGRLTVGGALYQTEATLIHTLTALTNGAGASLGTITNAPAAGNPTKWAPVDDNGTTRYVPMW